MIVSYDDVSKILSEIGDRLDVEEIAGFPDDKSWMIAINDESEESMALDYEEQSGKLFMTIVIGPAPEGKKLATYEFLLSYNLGWAETDGARVGVDVDTDDIVLIHDVTLHGLTADTLATVVESFVAVSRTMKSVIGQGIGDAEDGDDTPPADPRDMMGHLIA